MLELKILVMSRLLNKPFFQTLPGLTDQQKGVCTKVPETVESVPFGTRQGLVECEYQFRNVFIIVIVFVFIFIFIQE